MKVIANYTEYPPTEKNDTDVFTDLNAFDTFLWESEATPIAQQLWLTHFTAIGTSTLRSLTNKIVFGKPIIKPGGTLCLRKNNILTQVKREINAAQHLLLFAGGCDATDDCTIAIRPPHIINELLACFADLLKARALSAHAAKPLIIVLLLPRHLSANRKITTQLQEINGQLKNIIRRARRVSKVNAQWIDTNCLADPQYFRPDGKHLNEQGAARLAYALFSARKCW